MNYALITVGLRELKKMKNKEEDMELISNDNKSFEILEIEDEFDERNYIFKYKILLYKINLKIYYLV